MAKIAIVGGSFQDALGNPVAGGTLTLQLTQDAMINGGATGQVCSGIEASIILDGSGNASANVWPNDQLTPSTTSYKATVYTSTGQLAWGPQYETITGSGPFNLDTWVPTQ